MHRIELRNEAELELLNGLNLLSRLAELKPDLFESIDLEDSNGGEAHCRRLAKDVASVKTTLGGDILKSS